MSPSNKSDLEMILRTSDRSVIFNIHYANTLKMTKPQFNKHIFFLINIQCHFYHHSYRNSIPYPVVVNLKFVVFIWDSTSVL